MKGKKVSPRKRGVVVSAAEKPDPHRPAAVGVSGAAPAPAPALVRRRSDPKSV